jgi:NAD(P)-dependent dehydrogenase (short-subunit alcohol dehydrogenase family)
MIVMIIHRFRSKPSGIGYEIAKDLARRGAKVIMACRSMDTANEAAGKVAYVRSYCIYLAREHKLIDYFFMQRKFEKVLAVPKSL